MRDRFLTAVMRVTAILLCARAMAVAQSPSAHSTRILFRTVSNNSDFTNGRYRDLTYRTGTWYGSTFFTGPDWTRVGKNWQHPGQDTPSVRCFVVPMTGRIVVSGRVFKLHQSGDGIRATILLNEHEVWRTEIDGDDGQGVEHHLTLDAKQGDHLRFIIHKRDRIFCDTTGWDPSVRLPDGTTSVASVAFEHHRQGADGWWYQMDAGDAGSATRSPQLVAWGHELELRQWSIHPDKPIEVSDRDALPILVLANADDTNGLAMAAPLTGQWQFHVAMDSRGEIQLDWSVDNAADAGASVIAEAYRGPSAKGWGRLDSVLQDDDHYRKLRQCATVVNERNIPLSLRAMIQSDWRRQDQIDGSPASFAAAVEQQLKRTRELLTGLQSDRRLGFLQRESWELDVLANVIDENNAAFESKRTTWLRIHRLKRRIALANPLFDFGPLLVCKRVPPSWSHLVAQYFGWRQRPGGGLFVLNRPGYSLETRDILRGQLPDGSILEPRLSYDGKRILFAFVACTAKVPDPASLPVNETGSEERYFHLYEVNVDGSGLRQLTDGRYDDMMADYLPDGDIVFCSTRRKGYSRCFGPEYSCRWHSYTLHRMHADGTCIRTLSYNDVNEWFPCVLPSGHVLHARWDYIDRDAVTHQNLWSIHPSGTNSIAVWGNATPKPNCCFQAKPIPRSNKIVFIAAAHHAITAGPVCVLDPSVDANSLDAVQRITPLPFPESEGKLDEWYAAPWPVSERYFLVAYSPYRLRFQGEHMTDPNPDNALGIYWLDAAGNRELLYRDPDIGTTNPTPLKPHPTPPSLPDIQAPRQKAAGTMLVTDVYQGLGDVPRGTIAQLRVVQIFPKTTWLANQPRMGVAGEENGRAILGTVPVESDGSAYFEVPAAKPILFQALDENGMAYQTMRSLTFVQPGEQIACVGCHEHPASSPSSNAIQPIALKRPPSPLDPGDLGGRPFGFVEVVQPILNQHCVRCHAGEKIEGKLDLSGTPWQGFTRSYWSLCGSPSDWTSRTFDIALTSRHWVPRFMQRNQIQKTPPGGLYGARGSRLMKLLLDGHENVHLTQNEVKHLAAWIDLNAIFYGVYDSEGQTKQLRGKRVAMPVIQ